MNLQEIENIIFKPASNIMRKMGEEVFETGLISSVKGKKIENIYHIYGAVLTTGSHSEIKTHIKINLRDKHLEEVRCTCEECKEISKNKRLFMCEHLTGTAYKFLNLMENRKPKVKDVFKKAEENLPKERNLHKEEKRILIDIDIKIIHKSTKAISNYEVEFRLGSVHKHLITDLRNFIFNFDQGKSIYFNDSFTYTSKEYMVSHESIEIINFIREYTYKNNGKFIVGRSLVLPDVHLRKFLKCAGNRKVLLKYSGIEYKINILIEDLPLNFTLKEEGQYFKLTTHKKLPIPLSENRDVYFFNHNLYLPSKGQLEKYLLLYDRFTVQREILYNKTIENYNKIISLITSISKDISVSEEVKRFAASLLEFQFLLYKEGEVIYCDAFAFYHKEKANLLDGNNHESNTLRNFNEEEKILMKLEKYKFIQRANRLMFIGGDEDIFNLICSNNRGLHSIGKVSLGNGLEDIKLYAARDLKIDFYEGGDYFKLNYNIGDVDSRDLRNIFESYKSNDRFYKTKDNKFIDFEDEGIKDFFNLIQVLKLNEDIEDGSVSIDKNKALFIAESLKNRDYKFGEGIDLLKDIENRINKVNMVKIVVPRNLKAKLRKYQVSGFEWFKALSKLGFGGILADEMGLGKTVQSITFLLSEKKKKSLVIAPTSLIYNWQDEITRFAPSLRIGIAHGNIDKIEKVINGLEEYDVLLTTYGTLRNNIEIYKDILFDYCIIDEAQNIKNPTAQVTAAVKEVRAKLRFALTGTPIENNLIELWSIFDFIMPGYLYSKEVFDKKFDFNYNGDLENLKLMIKPFILRRTKKEVIEDLPDKIEKKILVDMTVAQKAIYSAYIKKIKEKMKNNEGKKIEVFSYLTRLRQICLDPSLVIEEYRGGSGKLKVAMGLVEENIASQGKALVFSQFTSALKKIGSSLKEKGIEYFYLDGATESKERIRLVNEFNKSSRVKVFLISLKAGGTGLNLTSANLVIHFDPWWNPAVENQASDRAHRIGQKNVVEVIKLVARGTIEEKIISLQEDKKELIHTVITGELKNSNVLNKLSREELVRLFYQM